MYVVLLSKEGNVIDRRISLHQLSESIICATPDMRAIKGLSNCYRVCQIVIVNGTLVDRVTMYVAHPLEKRNVIDRRISLHRLSKSIG